MRIWSLHPKYLDPRGLVGLWREGLLAQAVLKGSTRGYVHHPQLLRFWARAFPVGCIADYLRVVHGEAANRGYRFAAERISRARARGYLTVARGQLEFEWHHLMAKLQRRDPKWRARLATVKAPEAHPLFRVVRGNVAQWEKGTPPSSKQRTRRIRRTAGLRR